jgi:hypothetical protein
VNQISHCAGDQYDVPDLERVICVEREVCAIPHNAREHDTLADPLGSQGERGGDQRRLAHDMQ